MYDHLLGRVLSIIYLYVIYIRFVYVLSNSVFTATCKENSLFSMEDVTKAQRGDELAKASTAREPTSSTHLALVLMQAIAFPLRPGRTGTGRARLHFPGTP